MLVQFQLPFVPPPYRALFGSGTLPQFPYAIEDGWIVYELTTSHERLSRFQDELGVSKSSVSEVLHQAGGRIVKEFFAEPLG